MPAARMLWVCPRWSTDLDAKIGLILGGGRWTTTLGVRWVRRRLGRLLASIFHVAGDRAEMWTWMNG